MRTIISFVHLNSLFYQRRLQMRLIGLLGLMIVAALIFASTGKARIVHTPVSAMPSLRGEAATEYLKQQGLYSSLGEAVKAARFSEIKKLTASDPAEGSFFGQSVAIYEDTAIVGAPFESIESNFEQGAVYIFQRNHNGTDQWGQVKKLTASDGAFGDGFGSAAIYKDTVIVGAFRDPFFDANTPGSAYVFERNQGGADNWGEIKRLAASDSVDPDFFGVSPAIYRDTVIVGAPSATAAEAPPTSMSPGTLLRRSARRA
jgi:hypothetical protein